jgi:hypothetical protein
MLLEKVSDYLWLFYNKKLKRIYLASLSECSSGYQFYIVSVMPDVVTTYPAFIKEAYNTRFYSASYPKELVNSMLSMYINVHDFDFPVELAYSFGGAVGGTILKTFPPALGELNA